MINDDDGHDDDRHDDDGHSDGRDKNYPMNREPTL